MMGKALMNDVEDELQKLLIVDKLRRREGWYETRKSARLFSGCCKGCRRGRRGFRDCFETYNRLLELLQGVQNVVCSPIWGLGPCIVGSC